MKNQRLILGLFIMCAFQWAAQSDFVADWSSTDSPSKSGRRTELGKAVPSKSDPKDAEIIMNDPAISAGWGLQMTDAQKAWRISQGSKEIVVAVIDTGVDENHPDLKANLWNNPKPGDGKNGTFKGDIHGWNFVGNNNNLKDEHGHGTHIAGIIGAVGGNGIGISGVSPKVSLMILKYYDPKAAEANNLVNTVKAINYAVDHGANIINYSGGGLAPSPEEKAAIERAMRKGILFIAAAGNERSNSDTNRYYPADYDLPNILSVTAIDRYQNVLASSNFGEKTVDIAAPGNDIISTLPGGQYGYMTGTSQATAFATGVAALVMANNSDLRTADNIKKYLTSTGDMDEKLAGKTRYKKRLNSYKALATQDRDLAFNGAKVENTVQFAVGASKDDDEAPEMSSVGSINSLNKVIQEHLSVKPAKLN